MGLFKKKVKEPELKKLLLVLNRETLRAEYHCPYCNALLVEDNPSLIKAPDMDRCSECGKEFLK